MYGERVVGYRLKEHDYLQSTSMFLYAILQSIQALVSHSFRYLTPPVALRFLDMNIMP